MLEITNREDAMKMTEEAKLKNEVLKKLQLNDTIEKEIDRAVKRGEYSCSFYTFNPLLDILEYKKIYEERGFDFYILNVIFSNGEMYKINIYWDTNREKQNLKYYLYECSCGHKYASRSKLFVKHCNNCNKRIKGKKMYA